MSCDHKTTPNNQAGRGVTQMPGSNPSSCYKASVVDGLERGLRRADMVWLGLGLVSCSRVVILDIGSSQSHCCSARVIVM